MGGRAYLSLDGDLHEGYFYLLDCSADFDRGMYHAELQKRTIIGRGALQPQRKDRVQELLAVFTEPAMELKAEVRRECPTSPEHVTQSWWQALSVIPYGSGSCGSILQAKSDDGPILVRSDIKDRLDASGLSGFETAITTFTTQSGEILGKSDDADAEYGMWYLKFRGKVRLRSLSIEGVGNLCGVCGHQPIVCQTCRTRFIDCPICGEELLRSASQPPPHGDHSIVYENPWKRRHFAILEGSEWGGEDFLNASVASTGEPRPWANDFQIVTRRVVDFLVSLKVEPFAAVPISVNLKGMTRDQLEKLRISQLGIGEK